MFHILCFSGCKNQFSFQMDQGHIFRLEKEGLGCFECTCKENVFGDLYSECIQNSKCIELDCDKTQLFTPAGQCCPACSKYSFEEFFLFLVLLKDSNHLILIYKSMAPALASQKACTKWSGIRYFMLKTKRRI